MRAGPPELAVWIVTGVKAPKVMDFHDGLAFVLKVDDLSPSACDRGYREQCRRNA